MPSCIEVLKAPVTDAYRAEGVKVAQVALDVVSHAKGSLSTHTGTEAQDAGYFYVFNAWESVKHHQDLIDNTELYDKLKESLFKAVTGLTYLYHVNLNTEDPYPALNAPLTEIVIWTLKEGADRAELEKGLNSLVTHVSGWSQVYKGGWGPIVEDDRKYGVILGWNSLEEFDRLIKESATAQELVSHLKTLSDTELKHVQLTKYAKN